MSKAFVVTAACILLVGSMTLVAPVAAQEDNETVPVCDEGPPIPGQEEPEDTGDLEVVFSNDISGSMSGSDMSAMKSGSIGLIDRLQPPDEAGVVSYNTTATLNQELTTDYQAARDAINSLSSDGGEDISAGILTAHDELVNGSNASPDAEKVMVLFSDYPQPISIYNADVEAQAAKDDGIRIVTITLGDLSEDEMEEWETIASSPGDAYFAPTDEELEAIYDEVAGEIATPVGGALTIDTRQLFQPGQTHPYTVTNETVYSNGTVVTEDVTAGASVNTSNASLLTADEGAAELSATDDANASAGVVVTAEHGNATGCVNAIVAEASMENLELLPPVWRFGTFLGDWTIFFFVISIGAGIVGTRVATSFMGLSMMELVLIMGWFGGYISTGLVLTSVFACLFIGLNLAANIDYQVTR